LAEKPHWPQTAGRIAWGATGLGALQTIAPSTTEANRQRNRRAEIFLLKQAALPNCSCPLPGHPLFNTWLQTALRKALKTAGISIDGIFNPGWLRN
jgi:hypothetical protein